MPLENLYQWRLESETWEGVSGCDKERKKDFGKSKGGEEGNVSSRNPNQIF